MKDVKEAIVVWTQSDGRCLQVRLLPLSEACAYAVEIVRSLEDRQPEREADEIALELQEGAFVVVLSGPHNRVEVWDARPR